MASQADPRELVARAADATRDGRPDQAIADLRAAVARFRELDRPLDASHCAAQAGTIARLAGDMATAVELLEDAARLAGKDRVLARSALLELFETAHLVEDHERALEYLDRAWPHLHDVSRELAMSIFMKAAESLLAVGELQGAEASWRQAQAIAESDDERAHILLARATRLVDAGARIAPGAVLRAKAMATGDAMRSDIAMLESALAIADGDLATARAATRVARKHAIDGGSRRRALVAAIAEARIGEQAD